MVSSLQYGQSYCIHPFLHCTCLLANSLVQVVLHDVADYDLRKRKLESLKDRLEALLSPKLVAAFNGHSLGESAYWTDVISGRDFIEGKMLE